MELEVGALVGHSLVADAEFARGRLRGVVGTVNEMHTGSDGMYGMRGGNMGPEGRTGRYKIGLLDDRLHRNRRSVNILPDTLSGK